MTIHSPIFNNYQYGTPHYQYNHGSIKQNLIRSMRRKSIKESSLDESDNQKQSDGQADDDPSHPNQTNLKSEKKVSDEYTCGKEACGKLYHSYTAFYNHCKKSHDGIFPPNSLFNGKKFQGPSKNRGRPRIKKTDVKDSAQIESLKTQNELIQFLGTLPKKHKNEQIIVYVANPIQHLHNAIQYFEKIVKEDQPLYAAFIEQLIQLNNIISEHDLPDFYDPVEIHLYTGKMDSYSFLSIYQFFMGDGKKGLKDALGEGNGVAKIVALTGLSLMRRIFVIWLARILQVCVLAEVILVVAQMERGVTEMQQGDYMGGKTTKFRNLVQKYFDCIINEQSNSKLQSRDDMSS